MHSLKDNNPKNYKIFSEGNLEDRKWAGLTHDSFSNKAGYNEDP